MICEKAKHCTSIHSIASSVLHIPLKSRIAPLRPVLKFTMKMFLGHEENMEQQIQVFIVKDKCYFLQNVLTMVNGNC